MARGSIQLWLKVVLSSAAVLAVAAGSGVPALEQSIGAVARAAVDPLALIAARSPGARAPGALTQSKPLADRLTAASPDTDAGGIPEAGPGPSAFLAIAPPPPDTVPLLDLAPPAPPELPPLGSEGMSVGPQPNFLSPVPPYFPPVGLLPGGGGGPGGGTGGGGNPGGTVPSPPAIPEPGAWAMMLAGFLILGSTLRHARRWRPIARPA